MRLRAGDVLLLKKAVPALNAPGQPSQSTHTTHPAKVYFTYSFLLRHSSVQYGLAFFFAHSCLFYSLRALLRQ